MRLYNRNILRKRDESFRRAITTDRDAIIWSVDTNNYYALVKVQGSGTTIKAHFPRNWTAVPAWLKPGNAARIRHRQGVQGYVELVGHGRAIPTPVEGDIFPTAGTQADGIVSGMEVVPYSGGGMYVVVTDGTYRLDGTIYVFTAPVTGYVIMDDPAPMVMGLGLLMGWGGTVTPVAISAAPAAGYGRYDGLYVGADGVIDVVTGTAVSLGTEPSYPSTPADHVLVEYIFVYGGMTEITAADIGVRWSAPKPYELALTSPIKQSDGSYRMDWDGGDDYPTAVITVSVKDQYGNAKAISTTMTVTMLYGTGTVRVGTGSYGTTASGTIGASTTITYKRDQTEVPEYSPMLRLDFAGYGYMTTIIPIILLDAGGDPV